MARPNVGYVRNELKLVLGAYELIRDCLAGDREIKRRRELYLPKPNPEDRSPANMERYKSYLQRALFYNVTRRTLAGLVGQVFARDPQVKVPSTLDIVVTDATGSGLSLTQLAKKCMNFVISMGRGSLFVDYPATDGYASRAQIVSGVIRPTITHFAPQDVVNWRQVTIGGITKLSLVVIAEKYIAMDDGFEVKEGPQMRELRLIDAETGSPAVSMATTMTIDEEGYTIEVPPTIKLRYMVQIWQKGTSTDFEVAETYFPTDAQGNYLDYIPFTFVGSENNDPDVDNPPMYDLAILNVGHYRNSADYEESVYMVGQPTPWASGLDKTWVDEVLNGKITLGSRGVIALPKDAHCGILVVPANTLVKEAMDNKERQMTALGAKLVQQSQVQRTATEAGLETVSETSALSTAAANVGAGMQLCLTWAGNYVGAVSDDIDFKLNKEFDLVKMTPQEVTAIVQAWQGNAIATEEMRDALARGGFASMDMNEYLAAIEKQIEIDMQRMNDAVLPGDGEPDLPGGEVPKKPPTTAPITAPKTPVAA